MVKGTQRVLRISGTGISTRVPVNKGTATADRDEKTDSQSQLMAVATGLSITLLGIHSEEQKTYACGRLLSNIYNSTLYTTDRNVSLMLIRG